MKRRTLSVISLEEFEKLAPQKPKIVNPAAPPPPPSMKSIYSDSNSEDEKEAINEASVIYIIISI